MWDISANASRGKMRNDCCKFSGKTVAKLMSHSQATLLAFNSATAEIDYVYALLNCFVPSPKLDCLITPTIPEMRITKPNCLKVFQFDALESASNKHQEWSFTVTKNSFMCHCFLAFCPGIFVHLLCAISHTVLLLSIL